MKKLYSTLALAMVLGGATASGQIVLGYDYAASQGTYTPLTGATEVYSGFAEATEAVVVEQISDKVWCADGMTSDQGEQKGFALAAPISFNGKTMTHFVVYGAGIVQFTDSETVNVLPGSTSSAFGHYQFFNFAAATNFRGVGGSADTRISYVTNADGVTVEFTKVREQSGFWLEDSGEGTVELTYQISIATNGDVKMVYDTFTQEQAEEGIQLRIGLKGGEGEMLTIEGDFATATKVAGDFNNVFLNTPIEAGYTMTFTAPGPVSVPDAQPTDVVVTPGTDFIEGSFVRGDAQRTLVVLSQGALTEMPVNGTSYSVDEELGNGRVLVAGTNEEFTERPLDPFTDYTVTIINYNAYGSNGAQYRTEDAIVVNVKTLPSAPLSFSSVSETKSSITLEAKPEEGFRVLVAYSSEIEHDNYGDHAKIGPLTGSYAVGDSIVGGGVVAYIGDGNEPFTVEGLAASTAYYFTAYGMSDIPSYSSETLAVAGSTIVIPPYESNFEDAPMYGLPGGWTTVDDDFRIQTDRIGTEIITDINCINNSSAGAPHILYMNTVEVPGADYVMHIDLYIKSASSRFQQGPYNDWAEGDELSVECSEDGVTWTAAQTYNASNHPLFEEPALMADFGFDLSAFAGKTVKTRLVWKCFSTAAWGDNMYISKVSISEEQTLRAPVLGYSDVAITSAKLSWTGNFDKYEISYGKKGAEPTVVSDVEALEYVLTDLEADTEYEAKVRGISAAGETSEWSNVVTFTTEPLAPVAAPTDLVAEVKDMVESLDVNFSWTGSEGIQSYTLRYRESTATEYVTVEGLTTTEYAATGFQFNTSYIWSVRAIAEDGRQSAWSAQGRFTTPTATGVDEIGSDMKVYGVDGAVVVMPGAEAVEEVAVYDLAGRALAIVSVEGNEAVTVPVSSDVVVVVVKTATATKSYKIVH